MVLRNIKTDLQIRGRKKQFRFKNAAIVFPVVLVVDQIAQIC